MPKSKPPRSRLRRTPNGKPLNRISQRMIADSEANIASLQRMVRDVERIAHKAPADELASFREEMNEGIRCWTSVRNIQLEFQNNTKPVWPGIVKALEEEAARLKR
ncbi:hypothetical protein [Caulobacter hibisci]|uniref:Uncharacterized protein n=1 Tax=Caulobacter hibisci TaxID=2035993 RepID=A0ABS0SU71_9CAUL|nr:hypothetical protein [Caulobacter hibisci]MBI1683202.1 hypothetical protein [Caulobacter hibisci]